MLRSSVSGALHCLMTLIIISLLFSSANALVFEPGGRYGTGTADVLVSGDFNGDSHIDLAICQRYENIGYIHLNNGSGEFTTTLTFELTADGNLAVADFNNDGYDDLVNYGDGYIGEDWVWGTIVYLNNGDATFSISACDTLGSTEFATADFDGDSYADIVVFNALPDNPGIMIFPGNGDGTFAEAVMVDSTAMKNTLAVGDIDDDGDVDLLLYRMDLADAVSRLNNGDGTFSDPIRTGTEGRLGELVKIDDDQYPDMIRRQTYGCSGYAVYYLGNGDGTFSASYDAWITAGLLSGIDLVAADFSNDGNTDIALYAPEYAYIDVGLNDGRCNFETFHDLVETPAGGLRLATADFDGDGDFDLATVGSDDSLAIAFSLGAQHDRSTVVPGDAATIQDAIDMAWNLDAIYVLPGHYYENLDFGGKNLVLMASDGTEPGPKTSKADMMARAEVTILDGNGTGRVFTFDDFEDDRSVVSGFTIQNGYSASLGGGIYCYETASPTITDNIIKDNYAVSSGGGIFLHWGSSFIARNYIYSNSCGNWGGGIYACGGTFVHNTIYGNDCGEGGGGFFYSYGETNISTNIIWNNSSTLNGQQVDHFSTEPIIAYSNVQGGWPGTGNIDADPMFVDAANGDFSLMEGSPCINAGDPSLPLDPDGSVCDIGAYCSADSSPGCCIGDRGNANGDPEDKVNITDITYLIQYLFGVPTGPAPVCTEEGNANGDPEEKLNITDITYLIQYLFGVPTGPAPPNCP